MMNKVPPSKHVDTIYTAEKARLRVDKKGVYHLIAKSSGETACLPGGAERVTAADEQRNRIKENRIEENRNTSTQYILDNHSSETKADKAAAYTAEFVEMRALNIKKLTPMIQNRCLWRQVPRQCHSLKNTLNKNARYRSLPRFANASRETIHIALTKATITKRPVL